MPKLPIISNEVRNLLVIQNAVNIKPVLEGRCGYSGTYLIWINPADFSVVVSLSRIHSIEMTK